MRPCTMLMGESCVSVSFAVKVAVKRRISPESSRSPLGVNYTWSGWPGSNRRPPVPKTGALPLRYTPVTHHLGVEFSPLATSRLQGLPSSGKARFSGPDSLDQILWTMHSRTQLDSPDQILWTMHSRTQLDSLDQILWTIFFLCSELQRTAIEISFALVGLPSWRSAKHGPGCTRCYNPHQHLTVKYGSGGAAWT